MRLRPKGRQTTDTTYQSYNQQSQKKVRSHISEKIIYINQLKNQINPNYPNKSLMLKTSLIIHVFDHFLRKIAICTGEFSIFFQAKIYRTRQKWKLLMNSSPLLIKLMNYFSPQSIYICERGAFCYHWTTTYQPDQAANHYNLLQRWKADLAFGMGTPFAFNASGIIDIRLESSALPTTVIPSRQPSSAILCKFFIILTGSSASMTTKLATILSNLQGTSMNQSPLTALNVRLCLLAHSLTLSFTPNLSRQACRFQLATSIIFSDKSVAIQVAYISLAFIAQGSNLPVPQPIQSICLAWLKSSMLISVQQKVWVEVSMRLYLLAKAFHMVFICSALGNIIIDLN